MNNTFTFLYNFQADMQDRCDDIVEASPGVKHE